MSIEYNVSEDGLRIETFPRGILCIQDTIDYFEKLKIDTTVNSGAIEIVDFSEVTDFKISCLETEIICTKYQSLKRLQDIIATIFLCEANLAYGIGRTLKSFHEFSNPGFV